MNVKIISVGKNVAIKEKNPGRLKVHRSIMYSISKTHWGDRDSRGKNLCVVQAVTLKLLGDSRDSKKIYLWNDSVGE